MSDVVQGTPAPAAPASPQAADPKKLDQKAPEASAQGSTQASGQKHSAASKAIDEVMSTVKGGKQEASAPVDDVDDDGADLPPEKKQPEGPRKHKLTVKGKELEVDEKELLKRAQMGFSAEEKWQEAAKMRKQVEGFINLLQKDPNQALEKLGFDVDQLAEARIQQRIEEMKKTPEQLELERLRREHESILQERERERQELHQKEMMRMQNDYAVQVESEIMQAIDDPQFGLPKSPYFIKRIADVLIYDIKRNGKQTISASKAAEIVRDEVKSEWQEVYQLTPDEVFEQMVGKDRLNKYRRSKIKRQATKQTAPLADVRQTGQAEMAKTTEQKAQEKMLAKQFFKQLGSKKW
jgi:hypothetical protein